MLWLLADENFSRDIVRDLLLRLPDLDILRVQDVGLAGEETPRSSLGPLNTTGSF